MIPKFTKSGIQKLRKVLQRESSTPQTQGTGPRVVYQDRGGGTVLKKFEAIADWAGLGLIQAKGLRWNGSSLVTTGDQFEIRDFQGFAGKTGARGYYEESDGKKWHVTSTCPPANPVQQTQSFL